MSTLDDIAAVLTTAGVAGGATGWVIHKYASQPTPDQVIVLSWTGGPVEQATDRAWSSPTFQAMVRGKPNQGPAGAAAKANEVIAALNRATVNGFEYVVAQQAKPVGIGEDENGRHLFSTNFRGGES